MKGDRLEPGAPPRFRSALSNGRVVERTRSASPPDYEFTVGSHLVLDEDVSQSAGHWNLSPARSALGLDEDAFLWIPRSLDADDAGRQVNILPTKSHDLAPSKSGEKRQRPQSRVAF